jgi:hypothetical protein
MPVYTYCNGDILPACPAEITIPATNWDLTWNNLAFDRLGQTVIDFITKLLSSEQIFCNGGTKASTHKILT